MTDVVAVCGSLRDTSYTRTVLKHALVAAEREGAETDLIDLGEREVPMYDPDEDDQGVADLLARVRAADAVLLGSPVYHGAYSGALKNFHDFCGFDEYEDTVVGLACVAGGGSYASTLDHMRITVRGVHGWVLPHQVGIRNAASKFEADPDAPDGRAFLDDDLRDRVERLGEKLADQAFADDVPAIPTED